MNNTISLLTEKVNAYLAAMSYVCEPKNLYAPIEYVLSLSGKRIRPVLMLLAYLLYKEDVESVLPQAAGLETFHNYTLLHDDLMDRAEMRRNKPTVHKKWNDNTAILSGDAMLVLAFQLMQDTSNVHTQAVMERFTRTAMEICEGQQWDMEFERRTDVTVAEYIEMIRLKTSVLLATSLEIGALLGDAPVEDQRKLYDFGIRMGLAFQLQDDYLDVYGDPEIFGKNIGGDIVGNKKTFLLITALVRANKKQRAELERLLAFPVSCAEEKIKAVTALYDNIGVGEICKEKINKYYADGLDLLDAVALPSEKKENLRNFVCHLVNRKV